MLRDVKERNRASLRESYRAQIADPGLARLREAIANKDAGEMPLSLQSLPGTEIQGNEGLGNGGIFGKKDDDDGENGGKGSPKEEEEEEEETMGAESEDGAKGEKNNQEKTEAVVSVPIPLRGRRGGLATHPCLHDTCSLPAHPPDPFCYLHIVKDRKQRGMLRSAFAALDRLGVATVSDAYLHHADLGSLSLHHKCLVNCDLRGANLSRARLLKVTMIGCDLTGASLEHASLEKADLRGVLSLRNAKLWGCSVESTELPGVAVMGGKCIYHANPSQFRSKAKGAAAKVTAVNTATSSSSSSSSSSLSTKPGAHVLVNIDDEAAMAPPDPLVMAHDVYRRLKIAYKSQGDHEASAVYYVFEMDMKRRTGRLLRRAWLTFLWLICGYGESPLRLVLWVVVQILFFAAIFTVSVLERTVDGETVALRYSPASALYLSTSTFSTLGIGDTRAVGFARFLVGLESLLGSFSIALFVFVFGRKMSR